MKRNITWVIALCCLLILAGCAQKNIEDTGDGEGGLVNNTEEIVPTGEYVPTAEFVMLPVPDSFWGGGDGDCFYVDGEIFYLEIDKIYAEEDGGVPHYESRLLAVSADGTGTTRVVAEGSEGSYHRTFYVDKAGNLYLYEIKSFYDVESRKREDFYYLEKRDPDGQELFRVELTDVARLLDSVSEGKYVKVYADEEGNIAMVEFLAQQMLFLDSEGQYQGMADFAYGVADEHHITNNIVRAGERYFLWDFDLFKKSVILSEVDFQNKLVSEAVTIDISSFVKPSLSWDCVLLDGDGPGLLISTENVLWQYDLETGEETEVFRWDDENVILDGRCVAQIRWGTAGEGGAPMDILVYEDYIGMRYTNLMAAGITYIDKAYLPKRQMLSIGINRTFGNIEQIVCRFNRLNREYEAVLSEYSAYDLQELLIYGGEVPDLLDVTYIRTEWLETKELLEDLVPYFKNSSIVSKEDILPCVWELLEKDGKLSSMATSFTIRTMITAADIPEDGWDYDLFLGLGEKYPESWYFGAYNAMEVWSAIAATNVGNYIDWGKRECYFDSEAFRELLETIKSLDYPKNQAGGGTGTSEQLEKLMSQQVLLQFTNYGSPRSYNEKQLDSGGRIKSVGFPAADGEPVFLFSPSQSLAIYGESQNKDGAWAFLEFLLSEEEQSWYASEKEVFPVHAEAFGEYLVKPYYASSAMIIEQDNVEALEDTPDKLRYMVEHLGLDQNAADEIQSILSEELQAYFNGDKTVKETAQIIQNRVQLYLDEL